MSYWGTTYFASNWFGSNVYQGVPGSSPPVSVTRITVGFVGADFPTLSAAIASLVPFAPFTSLVVIEVHSNTPSEAITISSSLQPTDVHPLVITSFRQPTVASPFGSFQLITGSESLYPPPQPRLTRAVMNSFDIQANNVQINGFQINGDVVVGGNLGTILNGNIIEGGSVFVEREVATAVTCLISNNEIRKSPNQSALRIEKASVVSVIHNTILQRRFDSGDLSIPSFGIEVVEADAEAKANIFAAQGSSASAVRFAGDPSGSIFQANFYASFDGAKRFSFSSSASGPFTEIDDLNLWKSSFMASEAGSLAGDPEFFDRTDATDVDLDISNTSPAMAAAPAIATIRLDVRGERRPADFVTMGAHEHAEVITESGQRRFLELLAGISTAPVTRAVLGHSGTFTLFQDFPAQFPDDNDVDEIFSPVDIEGAVAPALPGHEGVVIFRPAFQVTLPVSGELLDSHFDRANEVGLLGSDNTVFLIKRMKSIPFDATGFMSTQFSIPIEINS